MDSANCMLICFIALGIVGGLVYLVEKFFDIFMPNKK
jgi:hypothetical protein